MQYEAVFGVLKNTSACYLCCQTHSGMIDQAVRCELKELHAVNI